MAYGQCEMCKQYTYLELHHVFGGARRPISHKYGLVALLCHYCHNEPPHGVHHNRENREKLQRQYQRKFEEEHPDFDFLKTFGKNYI